MCMPVAYFILIFVARMEVRALHMLSTCSTAEPPSQPFVVGFQSEYNFRMGIHSNLLQGEILDWKSWQRL